MKQASGENRTGRAEGMRSWGTNTPLEGTPAPPSAPAPIPVSATAPSSSTVSAPAPAETSTKPKKKKKGDKGGTGSKANSKRPKADGEDISTVPEKTPASTPASTSISAPVASTSTIAPTEPESKAKSNKTEKKEKKDKKRKRDSGVNGQSAPDGEAPSSASDLPEKTLKRLRKNLSKLPLPPSSDKGTSEESATTLRDLVDSLSKAKKESIDREDVLRGLKIRAVDGKWVLTV